MGTLYAPNAIISKNTLTEGKPSRKVLPLEEFYSGMDDFRESGFFEDEINREVRIFGTMAHIWSTFQIRHTKNGPIIRLGINNMQLHFKNDRWWILSWSWDVESEENKTPTSFDSY